MNNGGAVRDTPGVARRRRSAGALGVWLGRHFQALLFSSGEMWRARLGTALTVAVIGVALALPCGLHVAVDNVGRIGGVPSEALQLSVFLHHEVDEQTAHSLAGELRQRAGVAGVEVIPPAAALAEYARQTGLGDVAGLFGGENPLPSVLLVTPANSARSPEQLASLATELGASRLVESVQSDLQWSQRLAAWTALVQRLLLVVALLLGGGVLLVIGNTVRVAAQGRREEIAVARLCGATDSFIRRPFLYAGILYGLLGAIVAAVIVSAALRWLSGPVQALSALYVGDFTLRGPGMEEAVLLFLLGAGLGLAGAGLPLHGPSQRLSPDQFRPLFGTLLLGVLKCSYLNLRQGWLMNATSKSMQLAAAGPVGSLEAYQQAVGTFPMLSAEEERDLARRFRDSEDVDAAWQLVTSHLRFVVRIARGYQGYGLPHADLIQEGNVGLMKAVKRFDPELGVRLVSFAVHWVRAEMHEYILRNWRIVKVATTKAQRKLFFNLRGAKKRLGWLNNAEVEAVAADLGVKPETVLQMEQRLSAFDAAFDGHADHDNDGERLVPAAYLEDMRFEPERQVEEAQWSAYNHERLGGALELLDERSRDIVQRRWLAEDKATLQELADEYGVSAERIRQIEAVSIKKLRASFSA